MHEFCVVVGAPSTTQPLCVEGVTLRKAASHTGSTTATDLGPSPEDRRPADRVSQGNAQRTLRARIPPALRLGPPTRCCRLPRPPSRHLLLAAADNQPIHSHRHQRHGIEQEADPPSSRAVDETDDEHNRTHAGGHRPDKPEHPIRPRWVHVEQCSQWVAGSRSQWRVLRRRRSERMIPRNYPAEQASTPPACIASPPDYAANASSQEAADSPRAPLRGAAMTVSITNALRTLSPRDGNGPPGEKQGLEP
jgi:hypothetical protein